MPDGSPIEFNAEQKLAARVILSYISELTGMVFAEIASADKAEFHFTHANLNRMHALQPSTTEVDHAYAVFA